MRPPVDVLALVLGIMITGVAAAVLWTTLVGPLPFDVLRVGIPLLLVAAGLAGLVATRPRS